MELFYIYTMRICTTIFLILCSFGVTIGQTSWSVSETFVPLTGTTSSGVLHNYAEIESTLPANEVFVWRTQFNTDYPTGWTTFLQDPQTWHNPIIHHQEESFILNAENPFLNKLILQVMHNGYPGNGQVTLTVYPQQNAADSTQILYNITVTGPLLSTANAENSVLRIYPNPILADGRLRVKSSVPFTLWKLISIDGRVVNSGKELGNGEIDAGPLSPGIYFLQLPEIGVAERMVVQ